MKHLKILGLAIGVAAAFMAFVGAGSASAAVLCNTNSTPCGSKVTAGTEIKAQLGAGTKAVLAAGFAKIECEESTVNGKVENAGSATEEVSGPINTLTFGKCTGKVSVKKSGKLFVGYTTGTMNGPLSSEGAEVEVEQVGVNCTYGTPTKKTIGPVTGGAPAKLAAEASLAKIAGGFLCASPATWTASYEVTSPNPLYVAAS
jgi:hypothetical protein